MSVACATILFIATRRRNAWLRYTETETAFWLRLGFPPRKFVEAARRIEESRVFIYLLWFIVISFLILTLIHGGAYLHYKDRLPQALPNNSLSTPVRGGGR